MSTLITNDKKFWEKINLQKSTLYMLDSLTYLRLCYYLISYQQNINVYVNFCLAVLMRV